MKKAILITMAAAFFVTGMAGIHIHSTWPMVPFPTVTLNAADPYKADNWRLEKNAGTVIKKAETLPDLCVIAIGDLPLQLYGCKDLPVGEKVSIWYDSDNGIREVIH